MQCCTTRLSCNPEDFYWATCSVTLTFLLVGGDLGLVGRVAVMWKEGPPLFGVKFPLEYDFVAFLKVGSALK